MERQLVHLVRLIDDLLDVSRISRDKLELRRELVSLAEVVRHAVETSAPLVEQAGHAFELELPPDELLVDADPVRLAQVVSNLLSNACRYTERGGRIVLAVARAGGEAVISVRDNGIGIPPAMLDSIFEMFVQLDRRLERARGGLGIGLTLVKRLVSLHGGTIEARSEGLGAGSEFVVRLPLAAPAREAPPVEAMAQTTRE
jgi:signal transduction histidine kinase